MEDINNATITGCLWGCSLPDHNHIKCDVMRIDSNIIHNKIIKLCPISDHCNHKTFITIKINADISLFPCCDIIKNKDSK